MKCLQQFLVLFVVFLSGITFRALDGSSRFHFSSRSAAINLQSGAKLTLGSALTGFKGLLIKDGNATIEGSTITFDSGSFEENGSQVVLNGTLNPTTNKLTLGGSQTLRAQSGRVVQGISVGGSDNRLEGQPVLTSALAFDASATLTIAIQSPLSQNIQFDSGGSNTLRLEGDLALCDAATVVNDGTINVNGYKFSFGGKELTLTNEIFWLNAGDISLSGKLNLDGTWNFDSEATLNGHGNVLDVSGGGVFDVASSTTLHIADIVIRGITDSTFVFGDIGSTVRLSNVTLQVVAALPKSRFPSVACPALSNQSVTALMVNLLSVPKVTLWLCMTNVDGLST